MAHSSDPILGILLSVYQKQGNAQGADPYSYVAGNPETASDPTGLSGVCAWCAETGIAGGSAAAAGTYPTFPQCQRGSIQTGTSCSKVGVTGTPPKKPTRPSAPSTGGNGSGSNTNIALSSQEPATTTTWQQDQQQQQQQQQKQKQESIQQGQNRAYNDAQTAGTVFGIISLVFGLLATLVGVMIGMNWFSAPILWGLVAAFAVLATQAALIAVVFNGEGHSTGDSTDLNLEWFTKSNIEAQLGVIQGIMMGASELFSGVSLKWFKSLGADAALTSAEKAAGLNAFGISFGLTELFGGMALLGVANHFVDLQEGDVLT